MRRSRTQTKGKEKEIEIEGMKIGELSKTKHLGTTVTKDKIIEEEIKERNAAGFQERKLMGRTRK